MSLYKTKSLFKLTISTSKKKNFKFVPQTKIILNFINTNVVAVFLSSAKFLLNPTTTINQLFYLRRLLQNLQNAKPNKLTVLQVYPRNSKTFLDFL